MYKNEPWTLDEKKSKTIRTRVSNYIKERKSDLEIAVSRVRKFVELHKEKVFTIAQLSEALKLSEGTVSSIMNRLTTVGEINVVYMQRPHWSPVFQHASTAPCQVTFVYKKGDPIVKVKELFENNKNEVYTKAVLLEKIAISESMLNRCLQIFLTNGTIKFTGSVNGHAQYQHISGNDVEYEICTEIDVNYMALSEYLINHKLTNFREIFIKELKGKDKLFYSSKGIRRRYPIESMDKIAKKIGKKSILDGLFGK